jgi:hypothetical protein
MAEILKIRWNADVEQEFFNVTNSVGKKGVNGKNDVFLVQAMLRELPDNKRGGLARRDCPLATGTFDKKTENVIRKYQGCHKREKIARDCLINHAGGQFVPGTKRPWTIIQLNTDLMEYYMIAGVSGLLTENYHAYLLDKYPELSFMLLS